MWKSSFAIATLIMWIVLACKSRDFNLTSVSSEEVQNGSVLSTGESLTFGFHWSKDPGAHTNPQAVVRFHAEQGEKKLDDGNSAGSGLYIAADPFSTSPYGSTLIIVPILPKSDVYLTFEPLKDLKHSADILMYPYQGRMFTSPGSKRPHMFAAVIRNKRVIDFDNVTSIKVDKLQCHKLVSDKDSYKGGLNWRAYLRAQPNSLCDGAQYCMHPANFAACREFGFVDNLMNISELKTTYKLTDEEAIAIKLLELSKGREFIDAARLSLPAITGTKACSVVKESDPQLCFWLALKKLFTENDKKLTDSDFFEFAVKLKLYPENDSVNVQKIRSAVAGAFCKTLRNGCNLQALKDRESKIRSSQMAKDIETIGFQQEALIRAIFPESMATWK